MPPFCVHVGGLQPTCDRPPPPRAWGHSQRPYRWIWAPTGPDVSVTVTFPTFRPGTLISGACSSGALAPRSTRSSSHELHGRGIEHAGQRGSSARSNAGARALPSGYMWVVFLIVLLTIIPVALRAAADREGAGSWRTKISIFWRPEKDNTPQIFLVFFLFFFF